MAQWCERSPPTNVSRVRFPDPASYVSLLLVLFSAPRGFSPGTPGFPSAQKPTFPNSNSSLEIKLLLLLLFPENSALVEY